ncbi:uncharacterized protein C5orf46-like isoform X1 [Petaurus breviceps papuanus]|uniref:uncharacterized protein C5orf46-like isoform X1 n=1 Tax=Petaurus breviceps papuanus TaxID=3040969 RepID=UPI0036DBDA38
MASSVFQMMMAIGLLTLILPSYAGDNNSNSDQNQDKEISEMLSFLGMGIFESTMDYILNSILKSSGYMSWEDKERKTPEKSLRTNDITERCPDSCVNWIHVGQSCTQSSAPLSLPESLKSCGEIKVRMTGDGLGCR